MQQQMAYQSQIGSNSSKQQQNLNVGPSWQQAPPISPENPPQIPQIPVQHPQVYIVPSQDVQVAPQMHAIPSHNENSDVVIGNLSNQVTDEKRSPQNKPIAPATPPKLNPSHSTLQEEARKWVLQLEQNLRPSVQTRYRRMLAPEETDKRVLVGIFRELVFELTKSHCVYSYDDICWMLDIMRREAEFTFTMEEGIFEEFDIRRFETCNNAFKTFFQGQIHSEDLILTTLDFFSNKIGATQFVNQTNFTFSLAEKVWRGAVARQFLHEYFPHLREAVYREHASLATFSKLFEKFKLKRKPIEVNQGSYADNKVKEWEKFMKVTLSYSNDLNKIRGLAKNLLRKTITTEEFIVEISKDTAFNKTAANALATYFPHFKYAVKAKFVKDPYEHLSVYNHGKAEALLRTLATSSSIKRDQNSFDLLMAVIRPKSGLGFNYESSKAVFFCNQNITDMTVRQGFLETVEHLQAMVVDEDKFAKAREALNKCFNPEAAKSTEETQRDDLETPPLILDEEFPRVTQKKTIEEGKEATNSSSTSMPTLEDPSHDSETRSKDVSEDNTKSVTGGIVNFVVEQEMSTSSDQVDEPRDEDDAAEVIDIHDEEDEGSDEEGSQVEEPSGIRIENVWSQKTASSYSIQQYTTPAGEVKWRCLNCQHDGLVRPQLHKCKGSNHEEGNTTCITCRKCSEEGKERKFINRSDLMKHRYKEHGFVGINSQRCEQSQIRGVKSQNQPNVGTLSAKASSLQNQLRPVPVARSQSDQAMSKVTSETPTSPTVGTAGAPRYLKLIPLARSRSLQGEVPITPTGSEEYAKKSAEEAKKYLIMRYNRKTQKEMEGCKEALINFLKNEMDIKDFLSSLDKNLDHVSLNRAVSFMKEKLVFFRQEILKGTMFLKNLHWFFDNLEVDQHGDVKEALCRSNSNYTSPLPSVSKVPPVVISADTSSANVRRETPLSLSSSGPVTSAPLPSVPKPPSVVNADVSSATEQPPVRLKYQTHRTWKMDVNGQQREYVAVFTEEHILFIDHAHQLPDLPIDFEFQYKMFPDQKSGKIYLPDKLNANKHKECFINTVASMDEFENLFLNLQNVKQSSTVIKISDLELLFGNFEEKHGYEVSVDSQLIPAQDESQERAFFALMEKVFGKKEERLIYLEQYIGYRNHNNTEIQYLCLRFQDYTMFLPMPVANAIGQLFNENVRFIGQELEKRTCQFMGSRVMKIQIGPTMLRVPILQGRQYWTHDTYPFVVHNILTPEFTLGKIQKVPVPIFGKITSISRMQRKKRGSSAMHQVTILTVEPFKHEELPKLEVFICDEEKEAVGDVDTEAGVQFRVSPDAGWKVGLVRNGVLKWTKYPARVCTRSADISTAVDNREAILTSMAAFEKVKEKLRLVEANKVADSPQPVRSEDVITSFEFVDLFTAPATQLIDIPGIDEELARHIVEMRSGASNLPEFLDRGGFSILAEEIQYDVGLLGRNEMFLTFRRQRLDKAMLENLEARVFGSGEEHRKWMKRKPEVRCEILIAVLAPFDQGVPQSKKFYKWMKIQIKSQNQHLWTKCAAKILEFLKHKSKVVSGLKTRVIAKTTQEVIDVAAIPHDPRLLHTKRKKKDDKMSPLPMPVLAWGDAAGQLRETDVDVLVQVEPATQVPVQADATIEAKQKTTDDGRDGVECAEPEIQVENEKLTAEEILLRFTEEINAEEIPDTLPDGDTLVLTSHSDEVEPVEPEADVGHERAVISDTGKSQESYLGNADKISCPDTDELMMTVRENEVESAAALEKENTVMIPTEIKDLQGSHGNNEIVLEAIDADDISSSEDEMEEEADNTVHQASDISSDDKALETDDRGLVADDTIAQVSDISSDDIDLNEQPVLDWEQPSLPLGSPIISSDDNNLSLKKEDSRKREKKKKKRERKTKKRKGLQSVPGVTSDIDCSSNSSLNYFARQPSAPSSEHSADEANRSGMGKESGVTESEPTTSERVESRSEIPSEEPLVSSASCAPKDKPYSADEERITDRDESHQASSSCTNPREDNDPILNKEATMESPSVETSSNSVNMKWRESVEAPREAQSRRTPTKTWTERVEAGGGVNQPPVEISNLGVQDENVNTLNTDKSSYRTPSDLKRKLESLKDVCKNDHKTNKLKEGMGDDSGKKRKKKVKRKERRDRKRATPVPDDSSSDEESDFHVHLKKRRLRIRSSSEEELSSLALSTEKRREAGQFDSSLEVQNESLSSHQHPIKLIIKKNQISKRVEPENISVGEFVHKLHSDRVFQQAFVELKPLSASKIERRTKRSVKEWQKDARLSISGGEVPVEDMNANVILENVPLLETVTPDKKTFTCSLCDQAFDTHEDRHQHYLKHTEKPEALGRTKRLSCSICQKQFNDHSQRHDHYISGNCKKQMSAGENLTKKFKCTFCGEKFKDTEERSKHYLQDHLQKKDFSKGDQRTVEGMSQLRSDITMEVRM